MAIAMRAITNFSLKQQWTTSLHVPSGWAAVSLRRLPRIWVYDIRLSKNRVPRTSRIRNPWHKLIYTRGPDGTVEILAVVGRSYPSGRAAHEGLSNV